MAELFSKKKATISKVNSPRLTARLSAKALNCMPAWACASAGAPPKKVSRVPLPAEFEVLLELVLVDIVDQAGSVAFTRSLPANNCLGVHPAHDAD